MTKCLLSLSFWGSEATEESVEFDLEVDSSFPTGTQNDT
jgi:hypothetical protein